MYIQVGCGGHCALPTVLGALAYLAGASIVVVREIALSSSYVQMFVRVVDVTPPERYWNDRTMK